MQALFHETFLGDKTDHGRLWDHLLEAGAPHGMGVSGTSPMEIRRIEAGILDNITDMDMTTAPFQVGLAPFIDIDKEGFVGRAALLDADRRTVLYGVKCATARPAMNDMVFNGKETVGLITAGAWSPYLSCAVGYVRFRSPGDWAGRRLSVHASDGGQYDCDIVDLPFYDPKKWIARGLDMTIPSRQNLLLFWVRCGRKSGPSFASAVGG